MENKNSRNMVVDKTVPPPSPHPKQIEGRLKRGCGINFLGNKLLHLLLSVAIHRDFRLIVLLKQFCVTEY